MNPIDQIADERDKLRVKLKQAKAKLKKATLREDANALARDRVLQNLKRVTTAIIRARAMICDVAGIPHDADILAWISGARERIERMKRAGDDLVVCCESVVCADDVRECINNWKAAKKAKP